MEMQRNLRMATVILMSLLSTGSSQEQCPSPPVTYTLEGDNVTLCWQIPAEANINQLRRFTVLALKRPVQLEMQKVASANKDGQFFRTYDRNHDGVYKDRVTVDADLQAGMLFLRITGYTSKMENVYCVLYEMTVINDVLTCHSQAVFLRTVVAVVPESLSGNLNYTTAIERNSTETPQATQERTNTLGAESYRTELIIVSALLGVLFVGVICTVLCYGRARRDKKASFSKLPKPSV